jgi:hypothetical protein
VAERGARLEVTPRPAAEVEDGEGRLRLDRLQQRREVLAHVVIARPFPELLGPLIVMFQREVGDLRQVLRAHLMHRPSILRDAGAHGE